MLTETVPYPIPSDRPHHCPQQTLPRTLPHWYSPEIQQLEDSWLAVRTSSKLQTNPCFIRNHREDLRHIVAETATRVYHLVSLVKYKKLKRREIDLEAHLSVTATYVHYSIISTVHNTFDKLMAFLMPPVVATTISCSNGCWKRCDEVPPIYRSNIRTCVRDTETDNDGLRTRLLISHPQSASSQRQVWLLS